MNYFNEFDSDDENEHELYNIEDGRDWQTDEFFYNEMNNDICRRESDFDDSDSDSDSDKEFWDRELRRDWV